jgi:hypothetical protein
MRAADARGLLVDGKRIEDTRYNTSSAKRAETAASSVMPEQTLCLRLRLVVVAYPKFTLSRSEAMTHLGWILPTIGGYVGGILTGLFGHLGKYTLDKGSELKELIVNIKREISDFKGPPKRTATYSFPLGPGVSLESVRVTPIFSEYASDLESKPELIRWYWLIRLLLRLPAKKDIDEAAKLLPRLCQVEEKHRQESLSTAEKIRELLS